MADQEFLASFGVEIDETGLLRLQEALTKNRVLADDLAAAFNRAQEAMTSFFESMTEISMPTLDFGSGNLTGENQTGLNIPFSLDMTKATRELSTFFKESGKNLKLTADASGVVSAGQAALNSLRTLYASTTLPIQAKVTTTGAPATGGTSGDNASGTSSGGGSGVSLNTMLKAATGGRFTKPQQVEIAEDGDPEYVIPSKKEGIAVPLLRQLIGELSDSARESLHSGMNGTFAFTSAGESKEEKSAGTDINQALSGAFSETQQEKNVVEGYADIAKALSDLPGMLSSAKGATAPTVNQTNNNSVQAPVSINVTASGSDPEAVGKSVYDVAEQYLLRTLKGAI